MEKFLYLDEYTLCDNSTSENYCKDVFKIVENENFKIYKPGRLYFEEFIFSPLSLKNFTIISKEENYYSGKLWIEILTNESKGFSDVYSLQFDKSHFKSLFYSISTILSNLEKYLEHNFSIYNLDSSKNYLFCQNIDIDEKPFLI